MEQNIKWDRIADGVPLEQLVFFLATRTEDSPKAMIVWETADKLIHMYPANQMDEVEDDQIDGVDDFVIYTMT